MGCGAACAAFASGTTYAVALNAFTTPEHAWTRGFWCEEIVEALGRLGHSYSFSRFDKPKFEAKLTIPGTIIFVESCEAYPGGHFFARDKQGWMNPWTTFPRMNPVEAGVQLSLPGPISYIIYKI